MELLAMLALIAATASIIVPPLFARSAPPAGGSAGRRAADRKAQDQLADLEFDHATGKLADEDYAALRARVGAAAASATLPSAVEDVPDPLEAEIRAARRARRACPACRSALPTAARFCPACGAPAGGRP